MNKKELTVLESQKIILESNHITKLSVEVDKELALELSVEDNSKGTLLLYVYGSGHLRLKLNFKDYSDWNYLYMNESNESLEVDETVYIHESSMINANYGELTKGTHNKQSLYHMVGRNGHLDVRGASIAFNKLDWTFTVHHEAKDTYAMVENYGIVYKGGQLSYEVLGNIHKGMSRSKTHQTTRIMNMEEELKASVYPKLVIDENDVEASHAASVGQPDPEAIYYLESRGLSYDETIQLISLGYLIPIVEVIEDEIIREELINEITTRVTQ